MMVVTIPSILPWSRYYLLTNPSSQLPVLNSPLNEKVSVWHGDITRIAADAIVSSSDSHFFVLEEDTGIQEAILAAAGDLLRKECETLGRCNVGDAKITNGYLLPSRYVIHTTCTLTQNQADLEKSYRSCFQLMLEHSLRTIVFPCIATGRLGYPPEEAAKVAVKETLAFLEKNHELVDRVVFCVFLYEDLEIYEELLKRYFPVVSSKAPDEIIKPVLYETLVSPKEEPDKTITIARRSWVHTHFIFDPDKDLYQCNICSKQLKRSKTKSTGNLLNHMRLCHSPIYQKAKDDDSYPKSSNTPPPLPKRNPRTIDRDVYLSKLTAFLIHSNQPTSLLSNHYFTDLIEYISSDDLVTKTPNDVQIYAQIEAEYESMKVKLINQVTSAKSNVSVIFDLWSGSKKQIYLGVAVRYIDTDYKLKTTIIDINKFEGLQTGENVADSLVKVLGEFALPGKVLAVTSKVKEEERNAFSTYLAKLFQTKGIFFDETNQILTCLFQTINTCGKSALEIFEEKVKSSSKIGDAVQAIMSSPKWRDLLAENCTPFNKCALKYQVNCGMENINWIEKYEMIQTALRCRHQLSVNLEAPELGQYQICDMEWSEFRELTDFLKPMAEAMMMVSKEKWLDTPTTALICQKLVKHVDNYLWIGEQADWIVFAANKCKMELNNYISRVGGNAYVIGTILHPSFKLEWYRRSGWTTEWIEKWHNLVKEEWKLNYKEITYSSGGNTQESSMEYFCSLYDQQMCSVSDELEDFLSADILSTEELRLAGGYLEWWKKSKCKYPNLFKMALDYMTVVGCSSSLSSWVPINLQKIVGEMNHESEEMESMTMRLKSWNVHVN